MRSPFPGMDPYLERRWGDVHASLCPYIREALQPLLPRSLRARTETSVMLEDDSGSELASFRPDAFVARTSRDDHVGRTVAFGQAVTIEPVFIADVSDPPVDRWVQIIDVENGNRVVTAIEVLSPGNKAPGRLNRRYRRKVDAYLRAGVNVAELDLLRGRRHGLRVRHVHLPTARRGEYLYCVRRAGNSDVARAWLAYPMRLRDRLPVVPVPLRPTDADVTLDLQALIDRIYVAGGHDDIDYTQPLDPPLPPDDAAWLASLLPSTRPA